MTMPTAELNWQFDVNNIISGATNSTQNRDLLFQIKQALTSFPLNPWTVIASSNSLTSATSDLWVSYLDVAFANGVFSWIVLKQTGLSSNFQLLIGCDTLSSDLASIVISPNAGFTGGTISALPTATDQTIIFSESAWGGWNTADASVAPTVLHVMQSEDGYCTRIFAFRTEHVGDASFWFSFEKLKNPLSLNYNIIFKIWATDASIGAADANSFTFGTSSYVRIYDDVPITFRYTTEGMGSAFLCDSIIRANDITGDYQFYPAGGYIYNASYEGYAGSIYDFYFCPISLNGEMLDDGLGNPGAWICVRNVMLPWNNTTMLIEGV